MRNLKFKGIYQVALAVALSASLFASGCSDDDDSTSPPDSFAGPSNLTFQNGDGEVILTWNRSADDGSFTEFAGYNVYMSDESMATLTGSDLAAKLLGTEAAGRERSTITGLTNGELKYFTVRSVHENENVSGGTEVLTASVEGGLSLEKVISISEFSDKSANSAVDLSEGISYEFVIDNIVHVDFYLGTDAAAGDEDSSGLLRIKSPDVVDSPNDWSDRVALFKVLDDPNASSTPTDGFVTGGVTLGSTMAEIEDMVIAVKLPSDENGEFHYGKIEVLAVENLDVPGERSVALLWTYQPAVNVAIF